ncbi:MAG: Asp-tRNA(Asn)/Glu-tRNA(Gln) amidotransferase GatCAB subunit B, partial [Pseudomonadota bacterium]
ESTITAIRTALPELPDQRRTRLESMGLKADEADTLVSQRALADYFDAVVKQADPRLAANWVLGELTAALNRDDSDLADVPVAATTLATLLSRISDKTISGSAAKQVFEVLWREGGDVDQVIDQLGLKQITDSGALGSMVDEVLASSPEQVQQFRDGKEKVIGYLVGQVMKASRGKADPAQVNTLLRERLKQD